MNRKHVFLLNPAAGQGQAIGMREQIENISQRLSLDTEIYETKEELECLIQLGIEYGQGYYLKKPVDNFDDLLPAIKETIKKL